MASTVCLMTCAEPENRSDAGSSTSARKKNTSLVRSRAPSSPRLRSTIKRTRLRISTPASASASTTSASDSAGSRYWLAARLGPSSASRLSSQ